MVAKIPVPKKPEIKKVKRTQTELLLDYEYRRIDFEMYQI